MKIKKVIEVDIEKGDIFESDSDEFKQLVKLIRKSCKFIGGSSHNNIMDYIGHNQGGWNTCDVTKIEVLNVNTTFNKITLLINWGQYGSNVLIVTPID